MRRLCAPRAALRWRSPPAPRPADVPARRSWCPLDPSPTAPPRSTPLPDPELQGGHVGRAPRRITVAQLKTSPSVTATGRQWSQIDKLAAVAGPGGLRARQRREHRAQPRVRQVPRRRRARGLLRRRHRRPASRRDPGHPGARARGASTIVDRPDASSTTRRARRTSSTCPPASGAQPLRGAELDAWASFFKPGRRARADHKKRDQALAARVHRADDRLRASSPTEPEAPAMKKNPTTSSSERRTSSRPPPASAAPSLLGGMPFRAFAQATNLAARRSLLRLRLLQRRLGRAARLDPRDPTVFTAGPRRRDAHPARATTCSRRLAASRRCRSRPATRAGRGAGNITFGPGDRPAGRPLRPDGRGARHQHDHASRTRSASATSSPASARRQRGARLVHRHGDRRPDEARRCPMPSIAYGIECYNDRYPGSANALRVLAADGPDADALAQHRRRWTARSRSSWSTCAGSPSPARQRPTTRAALVRPVPRRARQMRRCSATSWTTAFTASS